MVDGIHATLVTNTETKNRKNMENKLKIFFGLYLLLKRRRNILFKFGSPVIMYGSESMENVPSPKAAEVDGPLPDGDDLPWNQHW